MGWKDLAKLGKDFVEAKKDELLTGDDEKKAEARARGEAVQDRAEGEATASFLESVLPADLATYVTAARPENVAAREAEKAVQRESARRADLADRPTAELRLAVTGEEQGTITVSLSLKRTEDDPNPAPDPAYPDQPPPMPWLTVVLEAADPVPVGSTRLFSLSLAVPDYRGAPGRYDILDLYERGQRGELPAWDPFDLFLCPDADAGDMQWYWDCTGPAYVDVAEGSLSFDLPMQSAASSIRATGSITWT